MACDMSDRVETASQENSGDRLDDSPATPWCSRERPQNGRSAAAGAQETAQEASGGGGFEPGDLYPGRQVLRARRAAPRGITAERQIRTTRGLPVDAVVRHGCAGGGEEGVRPSTPHGRSLPHHTRPPAIVQGAAQRCATALRLHAMAQRRCEIRLPAFGCRLGSRSTDIPVWVEFSGAATGFPFKSLRAISPFVGGD